MESHHDHTTVRRPPHEGRTGPRKPIIVGLLLITLGAVFLLHNLGTIDASALAPYWPAGLIIIGITHFFGHRHHEGSVRVASSSRQALE